LIEDRPFGFVKIKAFAKPDRTSTQPLLKVQKPFNSIDQNKIFYTPGNQWPQLEIENLLYDFAVIPIRALRPL
jgi:hypothetical protein